MHKKKMLPISRNSHTQEKVLKCSNVAESLQAAEYFCMYLCTANSAREGGKGQRAG
jgi:hypothetical protein